MKVDIFKTDKKYNIIYADPPWKQVKNIRRVRPKQKRELDYPTISIEEIKEIQSIVQTEEKHNVFMWTIEKYLIETERMMEELGYSLHVRMIWDKENGVPPAYTIRYTHEYLLWFYKKGNMLMPCKEMRGKYPSVLREQSTKHSVKPTIAYEIIEAMFPDAMKLEMYARNHREGWDCWGNEV